MTDKDKMHNAVYDYMQTESCKFAILNCNYSLLVMAGWQSAKESSRKELEAAKQLCETLKLEAQIHAQEARTANATIAEIYQYLSRSTGERGNWNGAKPVIEAMEAAKQRIADAESALIPKQLPEGLVPHAYGFEATMRNADYWYGWGHKEADIGKAVMCMAQAMFAWKNAALATAEEIASLKAQLAEAQKDSQRLDYVLREQAFMVQGKADSGGATFQLWTQDEDENFSVLHEDVFFASERAAIDAAMLSAAPTYKKED